ncbi:serine hydrolase domain-containing protein [Agromyces atrinae]|uniref:Class A beta-lactamase-related serine hydrolase n=1 Tax=Agromyces atrinae TaxID=592376 RepID=A0A4Q2MAJ2_9MICO|nr:serine hydrolase domain-containing protein [Agromyces atrinae]NYD67156.1 CubicO group peptidase (beta-lactamase class C family) [Agromyces atrinae]RXZ87002.1 class A beta-lactamase-related serine hydrolase [Agromyces atrinae]
MTSPLRIGAAALAAGVVLAAGLLSIPPSPSLQSHSSGDAALAASVEHAVHDAGSLDRVSVARVTAEGDIVTAGFGADDDTEYEIGSVTKTFTGNLLQIAIERGEVTIDETLDAFFPRLADTPAGGVTLASLANHTSGLPGLPLELQASALADAILNRNPYRTSVHELIAQTAPQQVSDPGRYVYSNLGMSLLGHALAERAGTTYERLVEERIFVPLGMTHTRIVLENGDLDASDAGAPTTGYSPTGIPQEPWSIAAYAPAGGIRSTLADMTLYVRALLDGTAPGAGAMDRNLDGDGGAEGYAWLILDQEDGSTLTLHNGQTGGFASFLVLDREAGVGSIVLSNTAVQLPDVAVDLITEGIDR